MSDLRELYQEVILDHNRSPRNFGTLENANRTADGYNPLCGDKLTLTLRIEDDTIRDIMFTGSGCAISTASASVMTELLKGKSVAEARSTFERFHALLTGGGKLREVPQLGKLSVFSGVAEFPARVKCATLAWHTLQAALEKSAEPVSTE